MQPLDKNMTGDTQLCILCTMHGCSFLAHVQSVCCVDPHGHGWLTPWAVRHRDVPTGITADQVSGFSQARSFVVIYPRSAMNENHVHVPLRCLASRRQIYPEGVMELNQLIYRIQNTGFFGAEVQATLSSLRCTVHTWSRRTQRR